MAWAAGDHVGRRVRCIGVTEIVGMQNLGGGSASFLSLLSSSFCIVRNRNQFPFTMSMAEPEQGTRQLSIVRGTAAAQHRNKATMSISPPMAIRSKKSRHMTDREAEVMRSAAAQKQRWKWLDDAGVSLWEHLQ